MRENGALPSQLISQIARLGQIKLAGDTVGNTNIKPASLDLSLGINAWCVKSTFLPSPGEKIEQIIKRYELYAFELNQPRVLTIGATFVIELQEEFKLDSEVWALVSPKSSSGRINLWVRSIADGFPRFDRLPAGYQGKLYAIIHTKSWPIVVRQGDSLTQVRFFKGQSATLSGFELKLLNKETGLLYDPDGKLVEGSDNVIDGGVLLTADLSGRIAAYQAKHCAEMIDLAGIGRYDRNDFFIPIESNKQQELILKRGEFYILPSYEYLRVPPEFAAEMIAYDIAAGEFRSHYAGFFDPGWGYGKNGTIKGTPAVLEIIPHEDVILRHRQPVCKMVYEQLLIEPDRLYGAKINSHYYNQRGPQLAKYFR